MHAEFSIFTNSDCHDIFRTPLVGLYFVVDVFNGSYLKEVQNTHMNWNK